MARQPSRGIEKTNAGRMRNILRTRVRPKTFPKKPHLQRFYKSILFILPFFFSFMVSIQESCSQDPNQLQPQVASPTVAYRPPKASSIVCCQSATKRINNVTSEQDRDRYNAHNVLPYVYRIARGVKHKIKRDSPEGVHPPLFFYQKGVTRKRHTHICVLVEGRCGRRNAFLWLYATHMTFDML